MWDFIFKFVHSCSQMCYSFINRIPIKPYQVAGERVNLPQAFVHCSGKTKTKYKYKQTNKTPSIKNKTYNLPPTRGFSGDFNSHNVSENFFPKLFLNQSLTKKTNNFLESFKLLRLSSSLIYLV